MHAFSLRTVVHCSASDRFLWEEFSFWIYFILCILRNCLFKINFLLLRMLSQIMDAFNKYKTCFYPTILLKLVSGALNRSFSFLLLSVSLCLTWIWPSSAPGGCSRWDSTAVRGVNCKWLQVCSGTHGGIRGPLSLQAVGLNPTSHSCRGEIFEEGPVGGGDHWSISITVKWEGRGDKLCPQIAHLREVVRGKSLVPAWFGHLKALKGKKGEEGGTIRWKEREIQKSSRK